MISKNQIKLIRQLEQKKYRRREQLFVAEGPKVVGDLLKAGFTAEEIFATPETDILAITAGRSAKVSTVSQDELRRSSFLQHPQQVLALMRLPQPPAVSCPPAGLTLALDGVQDPGNLGTIIRIADWFGIAQIVCSEDTADAWSPKVVQATMGSIARVNINYVNLPAFVDSLPASYPVYGMLLDGQNIYEQPLQHEGLIVMGNEGNGISVEMRQRITNRLLIPDFHEGDTADSLNVAIATAIACSEFRRRP